MERKDKKIWKIMAGIFVVGATSFGIATSSIANSPLQLDKNIQKQLKTYNPNNKNNNLGFSKGNEENEDIHIKGNQSAYGLNIILAAHINKDNGQEKDYFYLSGTQDMMSVFDTIDGNQDYKKIDLSSVLKQKDQNEVVQNFSLANATILRDDKNSCVAFWTKTDDGKYHIYTAGKSSSQLGREDTANDKYKTFKRIKNPKPQNGNGEYDFDEIKELSLTPSSLTIWTKDENKNDHIYFGGTNFGQFGDGNSTKIASNKLVDKTQNIKNSIGKNEKIKDIAFDYYESGFILTEDNKLFAAGRNKHGELGLAKDNITTFEKVNTDMLGSENIKQMSTNMYPYNETFNADEVQSLLLVTDQNHLWGLGYDGSHDNKGHSLGIVPDKGDYVTNITNISLKKIIGDEKILYAQTCSNVGFQSAYSFLITEDDAHKQKIYMAGYGDHLASTDPHYNWAYNEKLTNDIFGNDKDSGLDINFNIDNLGNTKYNMPVNLTTGNITAMGQIKKDKDTKYQEQSFVLAYNLSQKANYHSWKTAAVLEPMIKFWSIARTEESVDESDPNKRSLTYVFDIILNNAINIDVNKSSKDSLNDSKTTKLKLNYNFTPNGKNCKITINNIDPNLEKTYNKKPAEKFKISITYISKGENGNNQEKKMPTFINTFKSFKINKKPEIQNISNISYKKFSTGFEYYFQVNFEQNNNYLDLEKDVKVVTKGSLSGATANFHLLTEKNQQKIWKIEVTNLKTYGKYGIDNLDLTINYKNRKDNINSSWITEHLKLTSKTKGYNNFMKINFPAPSHSLSNIKIILIIVSAIALSLLIALLLLLILRKKEANAFAKYEAKKMSLDSKNYALSNFVQQRTKKETRQAIKEWKKQMEKEKKIK